MQIGYVPSCTADAIRPAMIKTVPDGITIAAERVDRHDCSFLFQRIEHFCHESISGVASCALVWPVFPAISRIARMAWTCLSTRSYLPTKV
jgi:hypothetical protein